MGLFEFAGIYGANPRRNRPAISPAPGAIQQQPEPLDSAGQPKPLKNLRLKNTVKITVNLDFAIDNYGKSLYNVTVNKRHLPRQRRENRRENKT